LRALLAGGHPADSIVVRPRSELDLRNQAAVHDFFSAERPDIVYLAAAKVGGIHANNSYPAEFLYDNLMIQANVLHAAHQYSVQKLMLLGSSCIYPRLAAQPMREEALLSGALEPTNEAYAVAKIAGIKLCESYNRQYECDYRSIMPTNLYGPGDNYHPVNSHVIPALIRRFHEAKVKGAAYVNVWGTGTPRREFLYVDDLASACLLVMNLSRMEYQHLTRPKHNYINVGCGKDISIAELADTIAEVVGYGGKISFDCSKPDGVPRKLLNSDRLLNLAWRPQVKLSQGLAFAYQDFRSRVVEIEP